MFNNLIRKLHVLDAVTLNPGTLGNEIGTDKIGSIDYELVKVAFGEIGSITAASSTDPLPVVDADANTKLNTIITLLGSLTFIQVSATFAGIGASTTTRLVYVAADETNNGDKSLYIYINGTGLMFLQTIV